VLKQRKRTGIHAASLLYALSVTCAQSQMPQQVNRNILEAVQRVQLAHDANHQVAAAEHLRTVTLETNSQLVGDREIHAIASLVDDRNDAVTYWVAEALGHFGQRARFIAPTLTEILDRRECMIAETSSVDMIRNTLKQIGSPAPPQNCSHYTLPR